MGNLGNASKGQKCPTPGFSDAEFMAVVDALANNPKVFGYNLSDEPHPSVCPNAANDIKIRSDYIHTHAPGQKAYITILDGSNMCPEVEGCEYRALQPENTNVDLIGLDPYPWHRTACCLQHQHDFTKSSVSHSKWNSCICHCSRFSRIWTRRSVGRQTHLLPDANNDGISGYAQTLEIPSANPCF